MANKTFIIDGKESELEVVGKTDTNQVQIFLHTELPNWGGWSKRDIIYGVSYDLDKKEIVGYDKFEDIDKEVHLPSNRHDLFGRIETIESPYKELRKKWGLERRNIDIFRPEHRDEYYGGVWAFHNPESDSLKPFNGLKSLFSKNSHALKTFERKDLEAVVETLRTAHIDFSIGKPLIVHPERKSEYVGEDPALIAKRNLEGLKVTSAAGARGERYFATHFDVKTKGRFTHLSEVNIETDDVYNDHFRKSTYTFEGGKQIEFHNGRVDLACLADPKQGDACFTLGRQGTRFLDDKGNEIGEEIGHLENLRRQEGIFKDSSGKEMSYRYKIDMKNVVLDSKGNKVADIDKQGFLK